MKLKLPVFSKRGKLWALVWYDPNRSEGLGVSQDGERAEVCMRPEEVDRLEVRAFRMVEA